MKEWENNLPVTKTWYLWKSKFIEAHEVLQRQIQSYGGYNQFGSSNAATMSGKPPRLLTGVTHDILEKMYDYIDNMAKTVTNKKSVLEKLGVTKTKKASTITTQDNTILALSDQVKKLQLVIINRCIRCGKGGRSDNFRKFVKD